MARAVVEEADFHARESLALRRDPFDRRDALLCARARRTHEPRHFVEPFPLRRRCGRVLQAGDVRQQPRHQVRQFAQRRDRHQLRELDQRFLQGRELQPRGEQHQFVAGALTLHLQRLYPCGGFARGGRGLPDTRATGDAGTDRSDFHGQPVEPALRGGGGGRTGIECGVEIAAQLSDRCRNVRAKRLDEHSRGVDEAGEQAQLEDPVIRQTQQPRAQGQQVAGKVSTVDGGNVARSQGLERLRVVPVIKVPLVPVEGLHRSQRIGEALDQSSGRDIAEVVGGQVGKERNAHVGRRRSMRNLANGNFLVIVGR